ncbi:MAG: methylmalonyl Co-A mutase-associated GTPase MeaB [Clostridia bacterium]|nr:methylmalonyl Co-A mutase-associated GTPase MeaB [Clostridia bacterium]
MTELLERFCAGERRALAKVITIIENNLPGKNELLSRIYPRAGKAFVVGVTGAPGAGKSSLLDRLTEVIRRRGLTVGVVAVDPTSPFTGGAILGDRIRMQQHTMDKGVFVRSLATRGSLGGLARSAKEVITALDAFGIDVILVETVGVGQSEVDIMKISNATLVVLTPAGGDGVQAIKAGIMEIADIFVVNKCDLPNAEKTVREINGMLDMDNWAGVWRPPVLATNTLVNTGIDKLWQTLEYFREYQKSTGLMAEARKAKLRSDLLEILENEIRLKVQKGLLDNGRLDQELAEVLEGADPYTMAGKLLKDILAH